MVDKNKTKFRTVFIISVVFFSILAINFYLKSSLWVLDSISDVALIVAIYFLRNVLKLDFKEFVWLLTPIYISILGSLGAYSWAHNNFQFDNFLHFYSAFIVTWIIFSHFSKTVSKKVKLSLPVLFLIVIGIISFFGLIVEITEFIGFQYLGNGDGVFFTGVGDGEGVMLYIDTMQDLVINLCGGILAYVMFYFFKYKKVYLKSNTKT